MVRNFCKRAAQVREDLLQERQNQDLKAYINDLRQDAKIEETPDSEE